VRRALAVVLAGRGEVDLVVARCRHDPSVHVRASAVQIVVRFAAANRVPWEVVHERFADAPEVRAALVSQIGPSMPPAMHELAFRGLEDPEEMVRREAFEVGIALVQANRGGVAHLRTGLEAMTSGECRNALATWFRVESAKTIADVLATASQPVRALALESKPDVAFTDLLPLIDNDLELYDALEHLLPAPPLQLLLRLVAERPIRTEHIDTVIARLNGGEPLPPNGRTLLTMLHASCCDLLSKLGHDTSELEDDERDYIEDEKRDLAILVDELERLVRSHGVSR
jgi:hypothetical protein